MPVTTDDQELLRCLQGVLAALGNGVPIQVAEEKFRPPADPRLQHVLRLAAQENRRLAVALAARVDELAQAQAELVQARWRTASPEGFQSSADGGNYPNIDSGAHA